MVMLEVKEVSHFLGGGVSSAFLQPHYLSLGLLVPHFISSPSTGSCLLYTYNESIFTKINMSVQR